MSTISNKLLVLLLLCSSALWGQEVVPDVPVNRRALLDLYVYGAGTAGLPVELHSLTNSEAKQLLPLGANVGMGIGFHMPNSWFTYMLRAGYHYQNLNYIGCYRDPGIGLHYLNIDARVVCWHVMMVGIKSDVLLSRQLPSDLPQTYLGYDISIFRPATLAPYLGISLAATPNLSIDLVGSWQLMSMFDARQVGVQLLDDTFQTDLLSYVFEVGLTYRIFTSGKRL